MSVKTYSNTDHAQLSAHFNVQEFKCKCGNTHNILISGELIDKLEQLYTALNCSKIIVTSGYRCPTHDKNVGGTSTGQHTQRHGCGYLLLRAGWEANQQQACLL